MTKKYCNGKGEELNLVDKLAFAFVGNRDMGHYLDDMDYTGEDIEEGKRAHKTARELHNKLSQVFSQSEINELIEALDFVCQHENGLINS